MSDERYDALINQNQTQNLAAATSFVGLWDVDTNDDAHNLIADVLLPNVFADTDVRVNYDYSRATVTFLYSPPAGSTLATPERLPPVRHAEHRMQLGFLHHLNAHVGLGLDYWYDRYDVEDFALGGDSDQGIALPPGRAGDVAHGEHGAAQLWGAYVQTLKK